MVPEGFAGFAVIENFAIKRRAFGKRLINSGDGFTICVSALNSHAESMIQIAAIKAGDIKKRLITINNLSVRAERHDPVGDSVQHVCVEGPTHSRPHSSA